MKFQPHKYQSYAIQFLKDHEYSMLLLDMGLGKTAISLNAIRDLMFDRFEVGKTLIVAPLRVARDVWPAEVKKWDGFDFLRLSVVVGDAKTRRAALMADADVYIVNRENMKWLVEHFEKNKIRWPFDMVVIDELSSFKNHQSQRWKYLKKMRPFISRMVGLTGTPTSNGLMDLWAEVGIIDGGKRLGRFIGRYREAYFKAQGMNPYTGVVYNYVPLPGAEEAIYERISDITISMKAKDYLEIPECLTLDHEVVMDPSERKLYEQLRDQLVVQVGTESVDAANAAVLSGKLLQMANGCLYSEDRELIPIHDKKLLKLEDLIEQANGQNVLIAYWYQHDRTRIIEHLTKVGYAVRDLKSSKDIEDWNAGKIPVGIISPASAGHGLNIQDGGHILIWFSQVWSLEMVQQTNARLWRQGQKEVVTIHRIICKDTVDEDVLRAIDHKDATQARLIAAVKAHLK
ncbi:MAG: DEAD/DEAH box helicase [Oscillospiraceae bacterium]|nr:DEAD/DEAH box helicase [Parasporobacterium sp.]MBQ9685389.1 DEAD/DEAH box helicase [Oscillospiraceae bacterium]